MVSYAEHGLGSIPCVYNTLYYAAKERREGSVDCVLLQHE